MSGSYEDVINLPHYVSPTRPHMPISDRAAQFSPFAALSGYEDAIHETARLTGRKIDLDESAKSALDEKLCFLAEIIEEHPSAAVTYFRPDQKKAGGEYVTASGTVKRIDSYTQALVFSTGQEIPLSDILTITSKHFEQFYDE